MPSQGPMDQMTDLLASVEMTCSPPKYTIYPDRLGSLPSLRESGSSTKPNNASDNPTLAACKGTERDAQAGSNIEQETSSPASSESNSGDGKSHADEDEHVGFLKRCRRELMLAGDPKKHLALVETLLLTEFPSIQGLRKLATASHTHPSMKTLLYRIVDEVESEMLQVAIHVEKCKDQEREEDDRKHEMDIKNYQRALHHVAAIQVETLDLVKADVECYDHPINRGIYGLTKWIDTARGYSQQYVMTNPQYRNSQPREGTPNVLKKKETTNMEGQVKEQTAVKQDS